MYWQILRRRRMTSYLIRNTPPKWTERKESSCWMEKVGLRRNAKFKNRHLWAHPNRDRWWWVCLLQGVHNYHVCNGKEKQHQLESKRNATYERESNIVQTMLKTPGFLSCPSVRVQVIKKKPTKSMESEEEMGRRTWHSNMPDGLSIGRSKQVNIMTKIDIAIINCSPWIWLNLRDSEKSSSLQVLFCQVSDESRDFAHATKVTTFI